MMISHSEVFEKSVVTFKYSSFYRFIDLGCENIFDIYPLNLKMQDSEPGSYH